MKRCPQCEFIYEDDQSMCDMDGVLLVFDSRTLPNLHAIATVPAVPRTHRRNRAVPVFATLILSLVLGMVYYVSTRRPNYTPPVQPSSLSVAPVTIPTPEPTAEPTPSIEETKPATVQAVKKPTTRTTSTKATANRSTEPKKEDSKVSSILKKTGRILKKPFKKF
jgi:hypothetical protein